MVRVQGMVRDDALLEGLVLDRTTRGTGQQNGDGF